LQEVLAFYARGLEDQRLFRDDGLLERHRTQELLLRYLPPPPAIVLDVGGGPGHYALWLAARGYEVHLVDPVPLHLEQARARSAEETAIPLASIHQGDARRLECATDRVDAVLLFGPLYHLPERTDRLRALREARRVLRADGIVLVSAISRFASALDGLVSHFFADERYAPTVWQDLTDGQHRGLPDGSYFTTAYLHRPEELASEMTEAGFGQVNVLAIEGPGWLLQDFETQWADPMLREALLEVIRRTESEASLVGASSHLMGVGHKRAGSLADG
jgi:ubiquinone/menaquinone biosynthesis C-methylase UbiE